MRIALPFLADQQSFARVFLTSSRSRTASFAAHIRRPDRRATVFLAFLPRGRGAGTITRFSSVSGGLEVGIKKREAISPFELTTSSSLATREKLMVVPAPRPRHKNARTPVPRRSGRLVCAAKEAVRDHELVRSTLAKDCWSTRKGGLLRIDCSVEQRTRLPLPSSVPPPLHEKQRQPVQG